MDNYFLNTFGCEMNYIDSEKINMTLFQGGIKKTLNYKEADLIILNTCSIRQKGENRVFGFLHELQDINKYRKLEGKKDIIIGITGCMVRKTGINKKYLNQEQKRDTAKIITYLEDKSGIFNNDDKLFPRIKDLDFTIRIEEIKYLNFILTHIFGKKIGNDDKLDDYLKLNQYRENSFSASVIIQTGCDNFCTFCIVPYSRGREVSRDHNDIIEEIQRLAKSGIKEISLVGQNVNSYGKQKNKNLWNEKKSSWNEGILISPFRVLLNDINKIDGIDRIRFSSSNPHDMTKDILNAHFELEKTCNHLHFALQSGNDEILKKMNRKHTYSDFKKIVEYLRDKDPSFSISTDIIVGFSGETEEMFLDTVRAMEELEIDFVYIARYSVRSGTIASKTYIDDISDEIKANRWHILNNVLEKNVKKRLEKMLGKIEEVLISGEKDNLFFGRTRNYKEVYFEKKQNINVGDIVKIKIIGIQSWNLVGEIV